MDPDADKWVSVGEARGKFRDLVDDVTQNGAHIYVLRYAKPVAVVVPVGWYEEVKAKIAGADEGEGRATADQ
jgi:PHD/YefM family antitoxin component YafN of YafNO toxin-antitoxin module